MWVQVPSSAFFLCKRFRQKEQTCLTPATTNALLYIILSCFYIKKTDSSSSLGRDRRVPLCVFSTSSGAEPQRAGKSPPPSPHTAVTFSDRAQATLRTLAPRIFRSFSSISARFASLRAKTSTSGRMGMAAASSRNSRTSREATLATLFISFSSQR